VLKRLFGRNGCLIWTEKSRKNLADFKRRLPNFMQFLDDLQLPYASLDEVDPGKLERSIKTHKWFDWPDI